MHRQCEALERAQILRIVQDVHRFLAPVADSGIETACTYISRFYARLEEALRFSVEPATQHPHAPTSTLPLDTGDAAGGDDREHILETAGVVTREDSAPEEAWDAQFWYVPFADTFRRLC